MTLARKRKPGKLLTQLKEKYRVVCTGRGIYRVRGMQFPVQILVTGELDSESHVWLRALSGELSREEAENFIRDAGALDSKADRLDVHMIFDMISGANEEVFKQILGGGDRAASEALRKMIEPELEELKELRGLKAVVAQKDAEIADMSAEIADRDAEIAELKRLLAAAGC